MDTPDPSHPLTHPAHPALLPLEHAFSPAELPERLARPLHSPSSHPHDSHETVERGASAQRVESTVLNTAATRAVEADDPLASVQGQDSVAVPGEPNAVIQSTSAPSTHIHPHASSASPATSFPALPNWAQLQASVSSPGTQGGGGGAGRLFEGRGAEGAGERGRTIYSISTGPGGGAGEGVRTSEGGVEKVGGGQGAAASSSRPSLTDYCVRDLANEAVKQAQLVAQGEDANAGEKRARSETSEDAEGEVDKGQEGEGRGGESPLAHRRRTDHPPAPSASTSTAATAYGLSYPPAFAQPQAQPPASYIHGLSNFCPPFYSSYTTGAGHRPCNPHSPICPPHPARAVWNASGVGGGGLGSPSWRYDPNHALQRAQPPTGQYGGYHAPSLPSLASIPLQPPTYPPIQAYPYPRPSPNPQPARDYSSDEDEESQRLDSSAASPTMTRSRSRSSVGNGGSPATSIVTPGQGREQENEKEVPLVSGQGGAVKLEQPRQPIAPASQQQQVEGGGAATGGKRKRGVAAKDAFTIDPIQGIKPFIVKLRWLLVHPEIAGDVICCEDGHSVLVKVGGDTSRLMEDILPRTFAHSNVSSFQQGQFVSYGFTSLKGADLAAALAQSAPSASTSALTASTLTCATAQLPSFGPSTSAAGPTATKNSKDWRAYTHLHSRADAALARSLECKTRGEEQEWQDDEWWFERDGMEDFVCLARLKARDKGKGGGKRSGMVTVASKDASASATQAQQGGSTGQAHSGLVQGLLASFKIPNTPGGSGGPRDVGMN
ncbi:hypothetical protein JCM10295v2_006622 [Rhodotorula toruloides]